MVKPKPFKVDGLRRLKKYLNITEIVDVGVNKGTPELISAFPLAFHHLFEPMPVFAEDIQRAYSHVSHVLHEVALSNRDATHYLVASSIKKDGVITHSQVSREPVAVDGKKVVRCSRFEVRRFESLEVEIGDNILLKVDVDGQDREVLEGFGEKLQKVAVIIIEATFSTLAERVAFCASRGFQLWDIVDLIYYGDAIYQCDLVLVRNDVVNQGMRAKIGEFDPILWAPFLGQGS